MVAGAGVGDAAEVLGQARLDVDHFLPMLDRQDDARRLGVAFDRTNQFAQPQMEVIEHFRELCGLSWSQTIRQVGRIERRLAEASRLGFTTAVVPRSAPDVDAPIKLLRVPTLAAALDLADLRQS